MAISGVLFSCAKEELDFSKLNLVGDPKPITVNAVLPQSAGTDKTTLSTDGKVCWESDDKITVNGTKLEISEILSDGTLAVFKGEVGAINRPDGNAYWATYPASLNATDYNAGSVNVTLPSTQTYNGDHIPSYMAAFNIVDGDNLDLQFKNLCCMLKFQVKSQDNDNQSTNKLSKIEVVSNQSIAGTAMVQMDGSGNPAFTSWTNGGKILTLNCGNTQLNNGEGVIFSVMLPAGTQSLSVKFYDATGKYMRKTVSGASLARSCMYNLSATLNATEDPSYLSGLFSVSSTKKVYFSPGNLQWSATNGGSTATTHATADSLGGAGTWRFASSQWDYIGNAAGNNTAASSRETQAAWIDLFGWGTSGYKGKHPYMTNKGESSYGDGSTDISGTNYDWGVYNAIYNPKTNTPDAAGTWRTLTTDEWMYVLNTRSTCSDVHYAKATVADVPGLIIVPDNWDVNTYALNSTDTPNAAYTVNNISSVDWTNIFEPAGCAFLPTAGIRDGLEVSEVGTLGHYWSVSHCVATDAFFLNFGTNGVYPSSSKKRHNGRSVRLVQDAN